MPIKSLTSQNFKVFKNGGSPSLYISTKNPLIVFFKMNNPMCNNFQRLFMQSSGQCPITHAVIDISQHKDVAQMSRGTSTVIDKVPKVIFYKNGSPYATYKGNFQMGSFNNFVQRATAEAMRNAVQNPQQTRLPQQTYAPQMESMPNMQSVLQGNMGSNNYAYANNIEDQDEDKMDLPEQITPHNAPWQSEYKRLGTFD